MKQAARGWSRRLLWLLVSIPLMLAALLLLPTMVNREQAQPSSEQRTFHADTSTQASLSRSAGAAPSALPADAQAPTIDPTTPIPPAATAGIASAVNAANQTSATLFLPLVEHAQKQRVMASNLQPTPTVQAVVAQPTPAPLPPAGEPARKSGQAITKIGQNEVAIKSRAAKRYFLAPVMAAQGVTNLPTLAVTASPSASPTSVNVTNAVQLAQSVALYLPLVTNVTVGNVPLLALRRPVATTATPVNEPAAPAQPQPSRTPTPSPTSAVAAVESPTATATIAAPTATATSATEQTWPAQQQVQTLHEQVNQLIENGALPAAEGQALLQQITVVMNLPIVTHGTAPPNAMPGQVRPWRRQMQLFTDQVDQLVASGVLSADQAQPLLDQAQAIIQTLDGR